LRITLILLIGIMIIIVDYKVGNLGSILNMLRKIGAKAEISSDRKKIEDAAKLILPGVGSYDTGVKNLQELELINILNFKVLEQKVPVLGICLGMQLLTTSSEEGIEQGFSWIKGRTKRFRFPEDSNLKVPHMGWNYVNQQKESILFKEMYETPKFYFVHSYYIEPVDNSDILATTSHGIEFCSSLEKENIFGTQFHPEKSHKYGMRLLRNFANL